MRRKILFVIIFMLTLLCFLSIVQAEGECNLQSRSDLRTLASNVNVVYQEIVEYRPNYDYQEGDDDADPELLYKYLIIKIYNLSPHLRIEMTYSGSDEVTHITFDQADSNGVITLIPSTNDYIITYNFKVYGSSTSCFGYLLRSIRLTLPKYNYFSERAICSDIPDYFMCQTYTTYNIDSANFINSVTAYKEKLESQKNEIDENGDVKNNISFISKTASFISEYKYFVIGIILVVGVILTILIVKKKRSVL